MNIKVIALAVVLFIGVAYFTVLAPSMSQFAECGQRIGELVKIREGLEKAENWDKTRLCKVADLENSMWSICYNGKLPLSIGEKIYSLRHSTNYMPSTLASRQVQYCK